MSASSKEIYIALDTNGVPITGAVYSFRDNIGSLIATFVEVQAGLYTVIAETGTYDIYKNGVKDTDLSPHVHIDSNTIPLIGGVITYGSGIDGAYTLDGSQASVAGLFTKNSATSYMLLRDGYFTTLTISPGVTLSIAGYRIFCSVERINNGIIDNSGAAGGDGGAASGATNGIAGVAAADATGGYLPAGGAGGGGGAGSSTANGIIGVTGGAIASYWNTVVGLVGKAGGTGGGGGSASNGGGAATGTVLSAIAGSMRNSWSAVLARAFTASALSAPVYNQTQGGSGGGGAGFLGTLVRGAGGGGAAAGNNGGSIVSVSKLMSGSGVVRAKGGKGGIGGIGGNATGTSGGGGGGGGGNGGNGGLINELYGADISTQTYDVTGGAGDAGGLGGTSDGGAKDGAKGTDGVAGNAGLLQQFKI